MDRSCNENLETHQPHVRARSPAMDVSSSSLDEFWATHQPHRQASSPATEYSWSSIDEFCARRQPHGQEITEAREVDGNQGNNAEMIDVNHQDVMGNSAIGVMSLNFLDDEILPAVQEMFVESEVHGNQAGNHMEKEISVTHQTHAQEITGGREVDGNQAGNNVEMDIIMNQQDVPARNSPVEIFGSLPNNEFFSAEQEMIIEEIQVHGNPGGNNIQKEILATDQPHAQEMIEEGEVNRNQEHNIEREVTNHQDVVGSSSSIGNKRRKKQSKVWEEMTKFRGEDGRDWARCIHCQKVFDGSSNKGTTHLKNHLERCRRKRNNGGEVAANQMDQTTNLTSSVITEEKSVIDLIKSCFDMRGFVIKNWDPFALNSRKDEIIKVYEEVKEELRRFFSQLSCRLSIETGFYFGHYVLSVCYIDNSWEQKEKIISVCVADEDEELHHNYQNLVKMLKESCLDLKIDGNICSIIYSDDEDSHFFKGDHEDVIGEINSWFNQRGNSLPFSGLLFSYDILCSICNEFEDNLGECLWNKFGEIRKCINYVKSTPSKIRNFQVAVDNAKSMGKGVENFDLFLEFRNRSIFSFGVAVGYKEAFLELGRINSDFKSRSINLTEEQWDEAIVMYQHCEELLDSFHSLAESRYTTLNQYFPNFCDAYMELLSLRQRTQSYDLDEETSTLIEKLFSELEKCNLVLAIAVILDPRFKMEIVQRRYIEIYGRDADRHCEKIIHDFTDIYNKYYAKVSEFEDTTSSSFFYLDATGRPCNSSSNSSSELERYLNDSKVPPIEKFDILAWWRAYAPIFPTLARMARDFLALPINYSMPLNFNFFTADDILNSQGLEDGIKEALLLLTIWLKSHEK